MSMMRRFFLLALLITLAAGGPARAEDVTINVHLGTGDSTVYVLRNPQTVLTRGLVLDGLPIRRAGGTQVIAWSAMRHLAFIPGDIPTVIITYRDRSESMLDVEPCRLVSGDTNLDIHDVAEIEIR